MSKKSSSTVYDTEQAVHVNAVMLIIWLQLLLINWFRVEEYHQNISWKYMRNIWDTQITADQVTISAAINQCTSMYEGSQSSMSYPSHWYFKHCWLELVRVDWDEHVSRESTCEVLGLNSSVLFPAPKKYKYFWRNCE